MKDLPTIKSEMTEFPYSVDVNAPVDKAQEFMRQHEIRHLPVTKEGVLVGVVTDRDIKLLLGPDFEFPEAQELKVSEAMVEETYVVDLSTPLESVLSHMAEHRLGSALVTDNDQLAGVFTTSDACRAFATLLHVQFSVADDETEL